MMFYKRTCPERYRWLAAGLSNVDVRVTSMGTGLKDQDEQDSSRLERMRGENQSEYRSSSRFLPETGATRVSRR